MRSVQESGLHRQALYLWYSFRAPQPAPEQTNALMNELVWQAMLELVKEAYLQVPGRTKQMEIAGKTFEVPCWQLRKPSVPLSGEGDITLPLVFEGSVRFSSKQIKALKESCEQCAHQVATQHSVIAQLVRVETVTETHKIVTKRLSVPL